LSAKKPAKIKIDAFDLAPGRKIAGKYQVIAKLGWGWEGEVYKVREDLTGIERAAKLFYPQRNIGNKASRLYAQKLHKIRHCALFIQYHTKEVILYRKIPVIVLISEYVEGELLSAFLKKFPGKRLTPYQAVHLLYSLAKGIEDMHLYNEYHGDLHSDNIIVNRFGLEFDLKILDFLHWHGTRRQNMREDVCGLIQIFHECMGGPRHYAKLPAVVKEICCGLKRSLIIKKFRTATHLREYLEDLKWF